MDQPPVDGCRLPIPRGCDGPMPLGAHRRGWSQWLTIAVVALALAAGAGVVGRSTAHAAGGAPGRAPMVVSRTCPRVCAAAYRAIADALQKDRDGDLARVIAHTPGFDYLELARALHVPTITQIRAQWRRYCRASLSVDSLALTICVQMIDSRQPASLSRLAGWASS